MSPQSTQSPPPPTVGPGPLHLECVTKESTSPFFPNGLSQVAADSDSAKGCIILGGRGVALWGQLRQDFPALSHAEDQEQAPVPAQRQTQSHTWQTGGGTEINPSGGTGLVTALWGVGLPRQATSLKQSDSCLAGGIHFLYVPEKRRPDC